MTDYSSAPGSSSRPRDDHGVGTAARKALSQAGHIAQEAADTAKEAASDTASAVSDHVKQMLDRQVTSGADVVGHVARSTRRAADDLEDDVPQIAGLVRSVADRIDGFAGTLHNRSADQLLRDASDFARRRPALVFGLSALAAFVALRTIKSTPAGGMPHQQQTWAE